jgi:hypothetical protein
VYPLQRYSGYSCSLRESYHNKQANIHTYIYLFIYLFVYLLYGVNIIASGACGHFLVRVNVRKIVGQDGGDDLQQCYWMCQPFITRSHLISLLLISIVGAWNKDSCILHFEMWFSDVLWVPYIKRVGRNSYIPALSSAVPFPSPGSGVTKLE